MEDILVIIEDTASQVITVGEVGPPGPQGPVGATGGATIEIPFAYGDATPATLVTATAGKLIYGVSLNIKVPFDGVGASLRVGDAGVLDRLMGSAENDPTQICSNTTAPAYAYGSNTAILLSITAGAGATTGAGLAVLYIQS